MPVNVWSAGRDELLGFMAERDAKKRLTEDRSRRDRLDVEASSDRERMRQIQEGQLRSIDEDRNARRTAGEAEAKQKALNAEQIGQLLDQYTEALTAGDQNMTQAIGLRILNAGGKLPPAQPRAPQPQGFTLSPGARRYDASGKEIASAPDRPKTEGGPKPVTPAQRLAAKLQAQRNASLHDRQGALPEGTTVQEYAQQLEDEYLSTLGVDVPVRQPKPTPRGTVYTGHDGTPDPTRPGASASGGDISLSGPTAPAAPPPGGGAPPADAALQQRAAVELQKRGKAVTPEAISFVIQQGLVK